MTPLILAVFLQGIGLAAFGFGAGFLAARAYYKPLLKESVGV